VRLICFGDIHMAFRAIERLGPVLREADGAILVGDLTHFGDPPDAFRVVDAVRAHCPSVLAVTGNLDMPWVIDAFRERGISLHGEGRRLGTLGVFGCGGSNVTPMDTPTELEEDEIARVLERAFIERHRPDVAVVGHIHEGRGVERLGDTLVLNAGALRDGGYVVVEESPDAIAADLRSFRGALAA
jgi:Icc-related predicted phosphoesterase